jgi:superkiller protein 3
MSQNPAIWQIYSYLGVAYSEMGRTDDAIASFEFGLKIKPSNLRMRTNLAAAYLNKEMPDKAISRLRDILAEYPSEYEAHYMLGIAYRNKGQYAPAVSELKEALRLQPDYTTGLYYLGDLYQNYLRDREAALSQYRLILALNRPDDPFTQKAIRMIQELEKP